MSDRILVIDDDQSTVDLVASAVRGREVLAASDVRAGLVLAAKRRPAAVLISVDIPHGFAACRKLKKHKTFRTIPIILLSGSDKAEQFAEHARLPTAANAYLRKPLDPRELVVTLKAIAPRPDVGADSDALPPEIPPAVALGDDAADSASELDEMPAGPDAPPEAGPDAPAAVEAGAGEPPGAAVAEGRDIQTRYGASCEKCSELEAKLKNSRRDEAALKQEITLLTERTANLRTAHRRLEEAFEMERSRYTERIGKLETEARRVAVLDEEVSALRRECSRIRADKADLRESLDVIAEALEVPMEIVARLRELDGQAGVLGAAGARDDEPSRRPIALGAAPFGEEDDLSSWDETIPADDA